MKYRFVENETCPHEIEFVHPRTRDEELLAWLAAYAPDQFLIPIRITDAGVARLRFTSKKVAALFKLAWVEDPLLPIDSGAFYCPYIPLMSSSVTTVKTRTASPKALKIKVLKNRWAPVSSKMKVYIDESQKSDQPVLVGYQGFDGRFLVPEPAPSSVLTPLDERSEDKGG
jgi:hypothetical protein